MADSNEMSLIMRIRTLFDGKGTKEAVDNVAAVGKSAKEMGDNTKTAAGSAEKSFAAISAATQVTEGGVMGVGSAVKNLAGQFPKLTAALGPLGLLLAAFAAWKKVYDELKDRQSMFLKALRDTANGNTDAGLKNTILLYNQMEKSISNAAEARQRLTDAEASKDDARLASELAKLDLAHAEAAIKLNPDDTFGRRKLDLQTSAKRAELTDASAVRKADRELESLRSQVNDKEATKVNANNAIKELEDAFRGYSDQFTKLYEKTLEKSNLIQTSRTRGQLWDSVNPELKFMSDKMVEIGAELKTIYEKRDTAEREIPSLVEKAEVNRMNRDTQVTTSKTGGVTRQIEARQIDYDAAEERERIVRELRDKKDAIREQEKRQSEMRDKTFKEYGDIRTAREKPLDLKGKQTETSYLQAKDAHDKNVEKELQEWKGLANALKENAEKKTKAVGDLRRDIERLNQKLENMPGQSN